MNLRIDGVDVSIDGAPLVVDATLSVPTGALVGIVGPNGSGKSTLLRTVYRGLRPTHGHVLIGEDDVWRLAARRAARQVAALPQDAGIDLDFAVVEVVLQGRTPHKAMFQPDTSEDWDIAAGALQRVGMLDHAHRAFATLSGGEKQRVLLARALTQDSAVLVLDEPTNHLDIAAQLHLLRLVAELGVTTIIAIHDLNHAIAFCDLVYVLDHGRVVAGGPCDDVLTPTLIASVFDVDATPIVHPATGRTHYLFSTARPGGGPGRHLHHPGSREAETREPGIV